MGKATLYHPVSLTVIRAAAIKCDWRFGKIKQLEANEDRFEARYIGEVDLNQKGYILVDKKALIQQVQDCFAEDVEITDIWTTRSGKVICEFTTRIVPNELPGLFSDDPVSNRLKGLNVSLETLA